MSMSILDYVVSRAYAGTASPSPHGPSVWSTVIFFVILLAIFYFLMIRPQVKRQKEHRKLVESLSVGDEVVTQGGILGRVVRLTDQLAILDIGKGTELTLQRNAIMAVLPKGTLPSSS